MESSSIDSHRKNGDEKENEGEFSESFKKIISTLPNDAHAWGFPGGLFKYQDFWHTSTFLEGILSAQQQFQAQSTDIILCSAPKTGSAWLKSLAFAIVTRSSYDDSTSPLLSKVPHDCVPFMEFDHAHFSATQDLGVPLLATHMPYSSLPRSVIESGCKIVYICRDPKDSFVSMYHFVDKVPASLHVGSINLDEAFELFCEGKSYYGPYWDHVLGYWKASLEHPDRILFLKYEDLRESTLVYVKKIAEFMGYPFSSEEKEKGLPEKIVNLCSFDNLSNLEVNRSGFNRGMIENKIFFRKGKVGDWENCLTSEMAARLDRLTMQKLDGSGLTL